MAAVYGIANCDSVKKARAWLAGRGIGAEFVDFKKEKPTEGMVRSWLAQIPLSVLLNRRGTELGRCAKAAGGGCGWRGSIDVRDAGFN